jgi:hypothetical protein
MPNLQLYLPGTPEIRRDVQPLDKPSAPKSQFLLAYLASRRNHSQACCSPISMRKVCVDNVSTTQGWELRSFDSASRKKDVEQSNDVCRRSTTRS